MELTTQLYSVTLNSIRYEALDAIRNKELTVYQAAAEFRIPPRTLYDKINNKHTNIVGHPKTFSLDEEKWFVSVLGWMHENGLVITRDVIRELVKYYLDKQPVRRSNFTENRPGRQWMRYFLERWAHKLRFVETNPRPDLDVRQYLRILDKFNWFPGAAPPEITMDAQARLKAELASERIG